MSVSDELLEAMRIVARQEIEKSNRDITKNGLVTRVDRNGTVVVKIDEEIFPNVYNYTGIFPLVNDIVKVCYPQGQPSNMYVSGIKGISTPLSDNVDFNKITRSGFYRFNSNSTFVNGPPTSWGQLLVIYGGGDTIAQLAFPYTSSTNFFMRSGNPPDVGGSGVWQPWSRFSGTPV